MTNNTAGELSLSKRLLLFSRPAPLLVERENFDNFI